MILVTEGDPQCSIAMSAEDGSKFAILHPQLLMSPYELKILEWDEKPKTIK